MEKEKLEEIKKALYKEKVDAVQVNKNKDGSIYTYWAHCSLGKVVFVIPKNEMGEFPFESVEKARLLNRWIKSID